jgi:hypothetical protein
MRDPSDWIRQFCIDLPIAQAELRKRGIEISDAQAQENLAEALGFGNDTTRLMYMPLPPDEIVRLIESHGKERPLAVKMGELEFAYSLIPEGVPRLLTEKEVKFKGEIWVIHKNDADPFPSSPHAHNYQENLVIHLGDGRLFRKREEVGRLGKKRFIELRTRILEELEDVELPALAV